MNTSTDSVRIVLLSSEDLKSFLVLTETDDPDNWKLPGGKFESTHETSDQAAGRELTEELGLDGEDVNLKQVGELVNDDGTSKRYIYTAQVMPHEVVPAVDIAKTAWVTEETLPESKNRGHILTAVGLCMNGQ